MLAKEVTEANCYSVLSCTKLLLIDVIFIGSVTKNAFTLVTHRNNRRMAFGAAKNGAVEQKHFFMHRNDVQSVANGDRRFI